MFRKLYGETDEDQLYYLGKKVKATVIAVIIGLIVLFIGFIGAKLDNNLVAGLAISEILLVLMAYYWGWGFMKAMFGYATFGMIFSGNMVIGVLILLAYVFLGYFLGIFNAFIGILRYIYLRVKYKNQRV